ncbi:MAG: F0F1 ATP synthase subunit A [Saprospiraceae bacterium]|nr:F0F1 ATP synthase subunit A [Saprospiraceae bacterium]
MNFSTKFPINFLFSVLFLLAVTYPSFGQHENHETTHSEASSDEHHEGDICAHAGHHEGDFDPASTAFHHIGNPNVYSIGPFNFPLPCILYTPGEGLEIFSSGKFEFDFQGHGEGHKAYKGYVLDAGTVRKVIDPSFPREQVEIGGVAQMGEDYFVCYGGHPYALEARSTMDGGLFGGGRTSFYDFSLTKNVVSMFLVFAFLTWVFFTVAKSYREREGKAPKGLQSFMEPMFLFIQDEVAKPFLGEKYAKYQPFLMALFFFILGLNLFGQIPFFGGSNVTGNLAFTMAVALFTFFVVNFNGKKDYWKHVLWMPGVPAAIKAVIITPVEILGLFIKPFTLMLRLFANITAGHIVVLSFIGLIFIFGNSGASIGGASLGAVVSVPLTIFMMSIELLVAFIQAFVFTILTASYIGAAIEEHHH